MAGIDSTAAEASLAVWLEAERKVALGQTVEFDGRRLSRANLAEIGERIAYWDRVCKRLSPATRRNGVTRVVSARG